MKNNYIEEIKAKIKALFPNLYFRVEESWYDGEIDFIFGNEGIYESDAFSELSWNLYIEYDQKLEYGIGLILDKSEPDYAVALTEARKNPRSCFTQEAYNTDMTTFNTTMAA